MTIVSRFDYYSFHLYSFTTFFTGFTCYIIHTYITYLTLKKIKLCLFAFATIYFLHFHFTNTFFFLILHQYYSVQQDI